MLCRNCNHNLSGEEDFCPHCGIPQKLTDVSSSSQEKSQEEDQLSSKEQKNSIFQSEPVYIYTDPPKEKEGKRTKATVAFVSLFIVDNSPESKEMAAMHAKAGRTSCTVAKKTSNNACPKL